QERRALAHHADDLKTLERPVHLLGAPEGLMEDLHLDVAAHLRPVGVLQRDLLVIVENGATVCHRSTQLSFRPGPGHDRLPTRVARKTRRSRFFPSPRSGERERGRRAPPHSSGGMFAALITSPQRWLSALMKAAASAGVIDSGVVLSFFRRSWTSGILRMST